MRRRSLIRRGIVPAALVVGIVAGLAVAGLPGATVAGEPGAAVAGVPGLAAAGVPGAAITESEPHEIAVLDEFDDLVAAHPEVLARNLALALDINRGASDADIAGAEQDDRTAPERVVASGLGTHLAGIYLRHLDDGTLPLTAQLLNDAAMSTDQAKKRFHYPRPFISAGFTDEGHPDGVVPRMAKARYADLANSGSFPSGHTSSAFIAAITLGLLVPEAAPTLLERAEEAGYHRVVLGVHYPLDVIGGRMHAETVVADRLAGPDFRAAVSAATTELRGVLEHDCGDSVAECANADTVAWPDRPAAIRFDERFEPARSSGRGSDVPAGAERLLSARFPALSTAQAREVLALTQADSGRPLDQANGDGSWQRVDLVAALRADVVVHGDGVSVNGVNRADRGVAVVWAAGGGVLVLVIAAVLVALGRRPRTSAPPGKPDGALRETTT